MTGLRRSSNASGQLCRCNKFCHIAKLILLTVIFESLDGRQSSKSLQTQSLSCQSNIKTEPLSPKSNTILTEVSTHEHLGGTKSNNVIVTNNIYNMNKIHLKSFKSCEFESENNGNNLEKFEKNCSSSIARDTNTEKIYKSSFKDC
ncbi:hypothetical protein HELRODRAFT_168037 [Helobdella robusta]|uniref:Uncharacterized protein n=1 Tax=Helobdella robusta TaxID=6412 RepID=T1F035_HELRO|nr:hypothetical protein HELRODRAFT_168037 [Helobdella robusta]ESO10169.1 hypothetical protein HELRODRAFT_168037 [Helobdella robusta]